MLFKIRHANGERKYLITAHNLTELTLSLNTSSKNVLLKCSFIRSIQCYSIILFVQIFPSGGGFFDTFDRPFVSHLREFDHLSNPHPLPPPPPTGSTLIGALETYPLYSCFSTSIFRFCRTKRDTQTNDVKRRLDQTIACEQSQKGKPARSLVQEQKPPPYPTPAHLTPLPHPTYFRRFFAFPFHLAHIVDLQRSVLLSL